MRAKLKGSRRRMRELRQTELEGFCLTDADKKILRTYGEIINFTCPGGEVELDYLGELHGFTEHYLELTRPDEEVGGTLEESWKRANSTVAAMWEVVRLDLSKMLDEDRNAELLEA